MRLRRCPLLDVARQYPEMICQVHKGLISGALTELGGDDVGVDLLPFAEPDACRLRAAPHVLAGAVMTATDVDAEQPRPTSRRTPAPRPVPRGRLALLLGGGVAMLLGLDAGLLLLGLPAPVTIERLPEVHGQLMLIGFLGTVIALERAVALRRPWGFSAPLATGFGSLLLLTALPVAVGQVGPAASGCRCWSGSTAPCGAAQHPPRSRSSGWVPSWPPAGRCCGPPGWPPVPCSPGWPASSC